ncbi:ABC transporter permease [Desulfovirgula thermocuniculi]|uniref:ABC transporter permease n=1 Tax=Desulfovirgula thermocuniculi TaxID=348842 RepID=UPI000404671F|nr:ABC transporter permease [Desulfovirgula thermocuniculi]
MTGWRRKLQQLASWCREAFRGSGGLKVIVAKELADHFSSTRMSILFSLVAAACLSALYVGALTIRETVGEQDTAYVFLRLFTTGGSSLPSFISFMSFLGPLLGLALGFDAINGEYHRRTLGRLLSQPIYRDDVINGKFLAGIIVLATMIVALGLLVAGLGLVMIGVPPRGEELARMLLYLLVTLVYVSFWLSASLFFSLLFRQTATSALAGVATWLFFAIFEPMLAGIVADGLFPAPEDAPAVQQLRNAVVRQNLSRLSPTVLYDEATVTLLNPGVRTLGPVMVQQLSGAIPGFLPLGQSLLLIWPHVVGLLAMTMLIFALAYYFFMHQEIRTS